MRSPQDVDHLSHSSVSLYLRCARAWAYQYLEELPRSRPSMSLLRGTAVDRAATANLRQKIDSHEDLPVSDVCGMAEDELVVAVEGAGGASQVDWEGGNLARAKDSTIALTQLHMRAHAPSIQPSYVQLELHRPLRGGRDFVGHLDFVEDDAVVHDIKTGSRRMGQAAADKDLQASAYAYLAGFDIAFTYWRLVDSGQRRYDEVITTTRSAGQAAWYGEAAQAVSDAIDREAFPPNPTTWMCSERRCAFWQRCQVEQRPPEYGRGME